MPSRATRQQRQFVQYHQRVLATDPIAYWLQNEKLGAVAYDWVAENGAQNGAYTGVTLGQPGIGDGNTAPYYDGTNDYTNIYTATLNGRFNGAAGTMMAWARVANVGVWTDVTFRRVFSILSIGFGDEVSIYKRADNNQLSLVYIAGGVNNTRTVVGLTSIVFNCYAITWSAAADEVRAYMNGVQQGATLNGLGVWGAAMHATYSCIGAIRTLPANVYDGYIGHCALWDRALAPAEIAALAVV